MASENRKMRMREKRLDVRKNVSYADWIAEADRFATREQIVAFSNLFFQEEVIPVVAQIIKRAIDGYEARRRERVWYRRLGRFLKGLVVREAVSIADLPPEALDELRAQLNEMDNKPRATEAPEPLNLDKVEPTPVATLGPTSCVVCASRDLGPVTDLGGVKCMNCGAILVDPPAETEHDRLEAAARTGFTTRPEATVGDGVRLETKKYGPEPVEDSIPGEKTP